MTQTQKNILICQARGWKQRSGPVWEGWYFRDEERPSELPNHFGSLDAMHEAEKMLTITLPPMPQKHSQRTQYVNHLISMCGEKGACLSTSAQRAEAFGLTLGLWKEGE